ncbi:MAG: beta-glucuronidase [Lachnospiraceae bacterium]|nr:beta-glucuronidase [Lachnospiraceae bacterium]
MIRLFEEHRIRKQQELDDMWDFVTEDGQSFSLAVPGCWEQHPQLIKYRGKGSYTRKVYISNPTNLRLVCKGVSHTADVYFDDVFVVHHYNAFTPFSGIIKNVQPGEHTIRIEVDNSFGEHSALHIPNDYYTYGGITRPIALEEIGDVYIENILFTPKTEGSSWTGYIEVWLRNLLDIPTNTDLICRLAEMEISEKNILLEANQLKKVVLTASFENVTPWNPANPKLYMLEAKLFTGEQAVDDLRERVGFREVTWEDNRLLINGESIFLKGFNRHEDYGVIGCAIPPQLMAQDLDMMMDMGANAVRTCHYPNDERFLDLCDERGILVWEENHARGLSLEEMQNPHFEEQCKDCIDEMITNHYNHPSIFIWGILNECASETPEGREMYRKQFEQIKSLDMTRPTTFATRMHFTDVCLDLPDVVSFNIYSGWYQDVPVLGRHNDEMDWIATAGGAGKPIIVSEFGAAAIHGYRDRGHSKWSEERQVDILVENFEVYRRDDRLSGIFIWQFADCRVTEEGGWFATRARSHNNKGVVDEYRRPKEAYDVVKDWFTNWEAK